MFDASPMYPEGYHPSSQNRTPSVLREAKNFRRSDVPAVKYYFTDFGISTRFEDNGSPKLVVGNIAQDPEIPELSLNKTYDPFAVDIFTLGNVFRHQLMKVCLLKNTL